MPDRLAGLGTRSTRIATEANFFLAGLEAGYRFQDDADGVYGGFEFGYAF
jgi:hypothetical protein